MKQVWDFTLELTASHTCWHSTVPHQAQCLSARRQPWMCRSIQRRLVSLLDVFILICDTISLQRPDTY